MADYTEDALVEQPAIALCAALGWETLDCMQERFGAGGTLGRETAGEVVLGRRLQSALRRLNPSLPAVALDLAVSELTRDRSALSPVAANRELYWLLKDGVKVRYRAADGTECEETVAVIAWDAPERNDFFLAAQFWIAGDMYRRRADLVGFVNGLPLVLIELKAQHRHVWDAYTDNLRDYKTTIPQLFWYNAVIILSNGAQSRIGTLSSEWEHFAEWKRIAAEDEPAHAWLETMLQGTCAPDRLLDLVENFVLFREVRGGLIKLLAHNHQVLGVNNAVAAVRALRANGGRLGVFWHTQGAGKSYSMVFFAQKVLRKLPGAWTFLVVTDRQDLDRQIYGTFAATGALTEKEHQVHAGSTEHLRGLLREDHRYLFTLIQKFGTAPGEAAPILSERSDIIVLADEAHRSQYDIFAYNMRVALPHAAFLGFTGTPLLAGEERTREVFGDYVSVYNFRQSIEDGATVPLYYENRIPELQLTNEQLGDDIAAVVEAAGLDDAQEAALDREFARQYHLITRDDRLDAIAADLVAHFLGRGVRGKAMVVSIDKATAVRMYDKVQAVWHAALNERETRLATLAPGAARDTLAEEIRYMRETDMAVVVSQSQGEVAEMMAKGLNILPHRQRMLNDRQLDEHFKDPAHPLRIVFVCAMWMTGFDAPSVSTIYLDKPMRNHTLMQTIARANRVFGDKPNGLIVDYIGVFRDLQKALAIYGTATAGDTPVQAKGEQVDQLRTALTHLEAFCREHGIDPAALLAAQGMPLSRLLAEAVEALVTTDDIKRRYQALEAGVRRLYHAILPDLSAGEFIALVALFAELTRQMAVLTDPPDIAAVMGAVEAVLDASIAPTGFVIREPATPYPLPQAMDLSRIDFDAIAQRFAAGYQHTAVQQLRGALGRRLQSLVARNRTRIDYLDTFQRLIDEYNAGRVPVEWIFAELRKFKQDLDAEEQRAVQEQLSEEELALFDLLTKPDPALSAQERAGVKQISHDLLELLKREKLVLDWRKRQQARAQVRLAIADALDQLPPPYNQALYDRKCAAIYEHVYESYANPTHTIYAA